MRPSALPWLTRSDDPDERRASLREDIEAATDVMERRMIDALGDDADRFFTLLDGWCELVVAAGGYPGRVVWPA